MEAKSKVLLFLGYFYIYCWFLDFLHSAVLKNDYQWLLWYSTAGLLLTSIALIFQNIKLIYSLFCALFAMETIWVAGAVYIILTHKMFMGLNYFISTYFLSPEDFYRIFYHALIPVGLLIAVAVKKETYRYGWLGAAIFATGLAFLTSVLVSPQSQVNCINSINQCHTVFSFLYRFNTQERIISALVTLVGVVFFPTNRLLLYLKKERAARDSD